MEIILHGEQVGTLLGFPITNTMLMSWLVTGVLVLGAFLITRKVALIPGRLQGAVELVIGGLYGFMTDLLGSPQKATKYFALVATIFLFVLFNNWFGILPILGALGLHEPSGAFTPLFRSAASDLNFTLILAVASVFMVQFFGIAAIGFVKYSKKFITFKNPIAFFIGILELISEVAKMISFSFRLFGNIFAGEVLLIIISFLMPYGAPLPFLFLEIFVGLVQALVFAILTLVFIKIATTVEH